MTKDIFFEAVYFLALFVFGTLALSLVVRTIFSTVEFVMDIIKGWRR